MRTTIDLPDDLMREIKIAAVNEGVKLKDIIRRLLEQGIRCNCSVAEPVPRRVRSEFPVIPYAGREMRNWTNAELNRLLDEEDAEKALKLLR